MHDDRQEERFPIDLEALLSDAAGEALKHEDADRFLQWCRERVPDYVVDPDFQPAWDPEMGPAFAAATGRALWNAIPLPGNGFRPRPLPAPGRNDPCPCGSGRKFKRCCAGVPAMTALDARTLWPFVLGRLPKGQLAEALRSSRLPTDAVLEQADRFFTEGRPAKASALLEHLFGDPITRTDEGGDFALTLLCNCYDDMGHRKKKRALLERVVATAPRSPLRSGAWQRLAAGRMDAGDAPGAWTALENARQDAPESPHVGILEVQLLVHEDRIREAKDRAGFWLERLRRDGSVESEPAMELLTELAEDPAGTIGGFDMDLADGAGDALRDWLEQTRRRPLPTYTTADEPPGADGDADLEGALGRHLSSMGMARADIPDAVAQLKRQIEDAGERPADESDAPAPPQEESLYLVPPAAIVELEERWRDVFPLGKPFSVQDEAFGDEDAWDPETEARWSAFLASHSEAADSLEILDDLATAVMMHPSFALAGLDLTLLRPLLERATAIVEQALQGVQVPVLAWRCPEVRPALRPFARLAGLHLQAGRHEAALGVARRLLAINPDDNHGFRALVINEHLRAGADTAALALAERYPDDVQPEVAYGRVLALFRLGRLDEATGALSSAMEHLPKVVRYLTAARVRTPKIDERGVQYGGDDQAWIYREEMRDVWLASPGALAWLKKTGQAVKR